MNRKADTEKNILFVCNSVYQVMVAVHIKNTFCKTQNVDIIISNHLNNHQNICKRILLTGVFRNVVAVENRKLIVPEKSRFKKVKRLINRIKETFLNKKISKKIIKEYGTYDELYVSNISIFTILLYAILSKRHKMNLSIFEDGFSTYSQSFKNSDRYSSIHRIINKKGMIGSAQKLFLFNPQLLEWKFPNGNVVEIPKITKEKNGDTITTLNSIFQTDKSDDDYKVKVLFMEESFFADGFAVDDVKIVTQIAKIIGVENIMIKLHPRNPTNRFSPLGFKTNKNLEIPWELILLNQDISRTILVSISSSSVLTPYLLFGIPAKSISLLNTLEIKPGNMNGELGLFMQRIYSMYPDTFYAPQTMESFCELLHYLLKQNK